jgi:hypothetical protein
LGKPHLERKAGGQEHKFSRLEIQHLAGLADEKPLLHAPHHQKPVGGGLLLPVQNYRAAREITGHHAKLADVATDAPRACQCSFVSLEGNIAQDRGHGGSAEFQTLSGRYPGGVEAALRYCLKLHEEARDASLPHKDGRPEPGSCWSYKFSQETKPIMNIVL